MEKEEIAHTALTWAPESKRKRGRRKRGGGAQWR